jgi:hypothetical protein
MITPIAVPYAIRLTNRVTSRGSSRPRTDPIMAKGIAQYTIASRVFLHVKMLPNPGQIAPPKIAPNEHPLPVQWDRSGCEEHTGKRCGNRPD